MSGVPRIPPAPMGQQGLPTRLAAFDSWRSLRDARGPLLLAKGTGLLSEWPRRRARKNWGKRGKLDTDMDHVNP